MPRRSKQARERVPLRLPDGREVELLEVHDPRARHLRLSLTARGPRLTIPPGASHNDAQSFLRRHLAWLVDHLTEDPKAHTSTQSPRPGVPGKLLLRGETLCLDWREAAWLHVAKEHDQLVIALPEAATTAAVTRALHDFLLSQARADVGRWLPRYLPTLPRAPRSWRFRALSSLWGSLSHSGALSLDLALILAPPPAFEYVLVHELCHLLHGNHSPAFWAAVEDRFPDWRAQRTWLRDEGSTIKAELRRLLG